jgi:hypothetical protein
MLICHKMHVTQVAYSTLVMQTDMCRHEQCPQECYLGCTEQMASSSVNNAPSAFVICFR